MFSANATNQEVKVKKDADLNTKSQFLSFKIDEEFYSLDISFVHEIRGLGQITKIPNSTDFLIGIMNIRGAAIPVFDLKAKFKMTPSAKDQKNVIILVKLNDKILGLLADAVSDILDYSLSDIQESEVAQGFISGKFIKGVLFIDSKSIILLDIEKLFSPDEIKAISEHSIS